MKNLNAGISCVRARIANGMHMFDFDQDLTPAIYSIM
jgi:hypothetical protein